MTEWTAASPGAMPYAGPPPAPFASPYLVVDRIPEIEPYVVNINKAKAGAIWGTLVAFIVLLWIGLIIFVFAATEELNPLSIMLLPALISIGVNCFIWYTVVSGGPQLAMNPYGMWIRVRKWPVKALFLPWDSIERIYVRRVGLVDRALCVQPRDPRAGSGLGTFANWEQALQQAFTGAQLTASVRFADRPEPEIMGAVSHFAAGRVWLG